MGTTTKPDGGSAFPYSALIPDQETRQMVGTIYADSHGMTLRDYFAAKALGLGNDYFYDHTDGIDTKPVEVARLAYQIADAMILEREK